jgi:hypothetical protein
MKFSLRAALAGLWALILALCVALAFLMVSIFEQGTGVQLREKKGRLEEAVGEATRRYERYRQTFGEKPIPLDDPQIRVDLESILTVSFSVHPGVEGGFWRGPDDSLAYAFPTHDGPRQKKDLPQAELGQIQEVIRDSLQANAQRDRRYNGESSSILLEASPLNGPPPGLTIWAMCRVPLNVGQSYRRLTFGLGAVLLLALGSGVWVLTSLRRWTDRVTRLEEAVASTPVEDLPPLSPTGERELDRIVTAFNRLNERLKIAREESIRLNRDLARSDRLATLGRMAAGLVHEIGNPLAAMRLRCENALAAEPERARTALQSILPQLGRLDELVSALRLLTRTAETRPQSIPLLFFLEARLEAVAPSAARKQIALCLEPKPAADVRLNIDEKSFSRAVENLLLNALQHTPSGGRVTLGAELSAEHCRLLVKDTGAGVPAAESERIFEPFVTTRPDGVGLGLSLVREIAEAHGGSARHLASAEGNSGATFVIEIPRHGQNPDR